MLIWLHAVEEWVVIVWSIWSLACGLSDQKTWATKPVTVSVPLWGQTPYETFGTFMRLHPIGWKLHIDSADGGIPVSCILISASMHDSQAAIPLAEMTAARVDSLYDLMDSAYDAVEIRTHSESLGHVPIIASNPRRSVERRQELRSEAAARRAIGYTFPEDQRYRERSTAERVNARLKDEFGGRHLRVRARPRTIESDIVEFLIERLAASWWARLFARMTFGVRPIGLRGDHCACMCDGCVSSKSAIEGPAGCGIGRCRQRTEEWPNRYNATLLFVWMHVEV